MLAHAPIHVHGMLAHAPLARALCNCSCVLHVLALPSVGSATAAEPPACKWKFTGCQPAMAGADYACKPRGFKCGAA